jgi:response regulator of citrate/malate metabolism
MNRSGAATNHQNKFSDKQRIETGSSPLTRGQINAVSAAFKAGVTPTRFARQFGLSQSAVRKTLAST